MTILLIGNKNLRNDAIKEILLAERGTRTEYLTPDQLAKTDPPHLIENNGNAYSCAIVDLLSFESDPIEVISHVTDTVQTDRVIAIHFYDSEELIQPLLQNGVDYYLPVGITADDLFKALDVLEQ